MVDDFSIIYIEITVVNYEAYCNWNFKNAVSNILDCNMCIILLSKDLETCKEANTYKKAVKV